MSDPTEKQIQAVADAIARTDVDEHEVSDNVAILRKLAMAAKEAQSKKHTAWGRAFCSENVEFKNAASPDVVLALLDRVQELERLHAAPEVDRRVRKNASHHR